MNEKRYEKLVLEAPEGFEYSIKEGTEGEIIIGLISKKGNILKEEDDGWDGI